MIRIFQMIKIKDNYIILLILLLACLFRLGSYNIVPLFSDTANYARISAEISKGDYWLTGPNASDKPPVFFYVQAAFFALFGVHESVAVLPSFLAGLIGVVFVYAIGKQVHGEVAGRWAAFMMAISPTAVEMSGVGLVDGLLVTTILWSFWLLLKQHFFWGGVAIGLAFGVKQTTLAFGPLYLYWIIICAIYRDPDPIRSLWYALKNSVFGFSIVFFPVVYWSIFLAEQRLKIFMDIIWRLGIVEKVPAGYGEFQGSIEWRISELSERFSQMIGVSWHFLAPAFALGFALSVGRVLHSKMNGRTPRLYDWLNLGVVGFAIFYLYVYVFHLHKLGGIAYLYPVFPLMMLSFAFLIADLHAVTEILNGTQLRRIIVLPGFKLLPWLLAVILTIWLLKNSINTVKHNIKTAYSAPSQGLNSVSKRLEEYVGPKSIIFTNNTRWGLGYYLLGVHNRTEDYQLKKHLKYMKSVLYSEPYTNSYILFYRSLYPEIEEVRKELSGQFTLHPEFESAEGNFRFFRIIPENLNYTDPIAKQGLVWNNEWEQWTKKQIQQRWQPDNLEIETRINAQTGNQEVLLSVSPAPFHLLFADSVEILIENPLMNVQQSIHSKWPIFMKYEKIEIHFILRDQTLEEQVRAKYPQITNLGIQTSRKEIRVFASGKMNGDLLGIRSSFRFSQRNDYTDIHLREIQINEWDLFWLTRIFKNRLIQPLKINRQHLFDSNLVRIESHSRVNHFYYKGSR